MRFLFLLLTIVGCAHRPIDEMILADVAVKAAQKSKADTLAPDLFRRAENYYLRAKKDYKEGYFDQCKENANSARILAEQAEFKALQKSTKRATSSGSELDGASVPISPTQPSGGDTLQP